MYNSYILQLQQYILYEKCMFFYNSTEGGDITPSKKEGTAK